MIQNPKSIIPLQDKLSYGLGNFSVGIAMQIIGTYLVFYSTAILGLPGKLVGAAVSLSIIWDALTDPIMGHISDNTYSKKLGKRHLYLIIGSLGLASSNYTLWNINPQLDLYVKFFSICILILLFKTSMTIYVTPYTALGAEMSKDYNERTSIQAIKTVFFLLGLAFVSVAGMYFFFQPSAEYPKGQLNPHAYSEMGLFSSLVILFTVAVCFFFTLKYASFSGTVKQKNSTKNKFGIMLQSFGATFSNKDFRHIAFSYTFNNIASALLSVLGLHVFTYTFLLSSQDIAFIIGIQFSASIIAQPIWSAISKKTDKKPAVIFGLSLSIIGNIVFIILVLFKDHVLGEPFFFIFYSLITGFGTSVLYSLPLSMVADTIDVEEYHSGLRTEGIYYGCLTLSYKIAQAVTILFVGFMLDLVGFDSSVTIQNNSTVSLIGLTLGIGSLLSFLASVLFIRKYSLSYSTIKDIQTEIS